MSFVEIKTSSKEMVVINTDLITCVDKSTGRVLIIGWERPIQLYDQAELDKLLNTILQPPTDRRELLNAIMKINLNKEEK